MELILGDYGVEQAYLLLLIIPAMLALGHYIKKEGMSRRKWLFLLTRFFIVSLIAISLTEPYITEKVDEFKDLTSITILFDGSESMEVTNLNPEVAEKLHADISSAVGNLTGQQGAVDLRYFSDGNRSEIGNALYQETLRDTKEKNLVILLSDGKNNYGRDAVDMAKLLRETNTTVFALVPDSVEKDIFIGDMTGDKKTPSNADYTLKVDVGKSGDGISEYNLNLRVDGKLIHVVNNVVQKDPLKWFSFTFSVKDEGVHRVEVEIIPKTEDCIKENNKMIKSVDVVERPDVLLVTDTASSQLSSVLEENYDVIKTSDPRQDYSKYDVVYFDNLPAERIDSWVTNSLHQYIVDGNGLVVVGGEQAYEKGDYHNNQIESLLPVISKEPPEKKREGVSIVILLDRSGSAGYAMGKESKIDVEKALTLNILDQLDEEDMIGLIAFDTQAYVVTPIRRWGDMQLDLKDTILRLQSGMGGTEPYSALEGAETLFAKCGKECDGKRFILIVSDGTFMYSKMSTYIAQVQRMLDSGIQTYAVGVMSTGDSLTGSEKNLLTLATEGNGLYFKPNEYERLKLEFEEKDNEEKDMYSLGVYNKYHFITRDLVNFHPPIKDFNGVTEKSVAQVLVTTEGKMPILAVWRFGLGRVVSLTVDNGLLWAPNIYYSNEGELVSAMTNWAIGNLEKRKRVNIETVDVSLGDATEILIKSDKEPQLFLQEEGGLKSLTLKQVDIDMYTASYAPQNPGFYMIRAVSSLGEDTDAIAVDIPIEYRSLGVDLEALTDITETTSGRLYNLSEMSTMEQDVLEYAKKSSSVSALEKNSLKTYFMAAALALLVIDILARRVLDIIRLRRGKE